MGAAGYEKEQAKFEEKVSPQIMPGEKVLWTGGTLKKSSMIERKAEAVKLLYIIPFILWLIGGFLIVVCVLTAEWSGVIFSLIFFIGLGLLFYIATRNTYAVNAYAVTDKRFIIVDKAGSRAYDIRNIINVRNFETKRRMGFVDFMIYGFGAYTMRGIEDPVSVSELICRTAFEAAQNTNNMQQRY
ncbi:MAG: SoxR reducing system RseC family protein [Ruminococcus sp.]|nr:SoxR reducing system RseC family protein [Ruminococcus sp.]